MERNKYCCRVFPVILYLMSICIALAIWYFDEGIQNFLFLTNKTELINLLGTSLFIFALPVGIFYLSGEKERLKNHSKQLALLGFLPSLLFLAYGIFF